MMLLRILLPVSISLLFLTATVTQANSIGELYRSYEAAMPGETGIDAAGKSITVGHMRLQFESGALLPILPAATDETTDAEPIGVFFMGVGQFHYEADPHEAGVLAKNLKRETRYSLSNGGFGGPFTSAILWGPKHSDVLLSTVDGEDATVNRVEDQLKEWKAQRESDDSLRWEDLQAGLAYATREGYDDSSWIDIRSGRSRLRHRYDPHVSHMERIGVIKEFDTTIGWLKHQSYGQTIAQQPIGHGWLEPVPAIVRLTDVDLELTQVDEKVGRMQVRETFSFDSPASVLHLDFTTTHISNLLEYKSKLTKVSVDGTAASFLTSGGELWVDLPKRIEAGSSAVVTFDVEGEFLLRPGGDSYWWLGTDSWLPLPGTLAGQFFTYHATVKVQQPFIAFSNGTTVRRWEEEGLNCAEFKEENPILLPVILAGKYNIYERDENGLKMVIASYAGKKTARKKQMSENLYALLEVYKKLLGDYPYKELKVLEINSVGFGQAPPGIIFITSEAFEPGHGGWSIGVNERLAHELAHTWWGDILPWASPQDQWLSDSLADYYAAVAMGLLWRQKEFDNAIKYWRQSSREVQNDSVLLANMLVGSDGFRERRDLLYSKGPLVLHALRQRIGDQAFFTAFKSLVTNFRFKFVSTNDTIRMIEFVSKQDHRAWMEENLLGTGWPDELDRKKKK